MVLSEMTHRCMIYTQGQEMQCKYKCVSNQSAGLGFKKQGFAADPQGKQFLFFLFVILMSRRSMNFISNALKLLSPCIFSRSCPFRLGLKRLLLLVCSRAQLSGILLSAGDSCHINKIAQINDYFATGLV